MRSLQCQLLRRTDAFGNLRVFLFCIGMFHFNWYALLINFALMWHFGFKRLVEITKKGKKVKEDVKKFNDCDSFFYLVFEGDFVVTSSGHSFFLGFLFHALDEFGQQREKLGLEDSWDGFFDYLRLDTQDELRKFVSYIVHLSSCLSV